MGHIPAVRTLPSVKALGYACFGENRYKAARNRWSGFFLLNGELDEILGINSSTHRLIGFCKHNRHFDLGVQVPPFLLIITYCYRRPSFCFVSSSLFLFSLHRSQGKLSIYLRHQTTAPFLSIPIKRYTMRKVTVVKLSQVVPR